MRISSIKYLLSEGFKNVWKNWMMSIASIGVLMLCLILTGSAALFSINVTSILDNIESQNSVTIYLNDDIETIDAREIGDQIAALQNVESCEFFSKEQAIDEFVERLGPSFEGLKDENFLPHSFHVTLKDIAQYNDTVEQIKQINGVNEVVNRAEVFEKLAQFDKFVSLVGTLVVLILIIVSLFIVSNTIRLTMYNRRFEISIMKSVGATDWFVRIPFIVEGVIIGLISAVLSSVIINLTYSMIIDYLHNAVPFLQISYPTVPPFVFVAFMLAGILFGLIGGLISIGKYLKKEGGEILGW